MRCTNLYFLVFLFILCKSFYAFAGNDPVVNYKFDHVQLIDAINHLIYKHHIPIVYVKNQVDSIYVTEQCINCNAEQALKNILKHSVLQYKKVNNQFILFNPKPETSGQKINESNIKGIVIDSITREPLPYASIVIERTNKGAVSNEQGKFKIDNLSPDLYKLKILYMGYATDSIIADLRQPQNSQFMDIELSSKNKEIAAVEINTNALEKTATTSDVTITTIDPKLLKTIPTLDPGDVVQNIKLIPGVNAMPNNLGGFNLRGGSVDQTLVQIDNIPLYHSVHLWGFNSSFNSEAIESLSIQSGGFSAGYSDRLSGVVDIKGKSGGKNGIHGGLFVNLFAAKAYITTPISKRISLLLSINSSTNFWNLNAKILNRDDFFFFNHYQGIQFTEINGNPSLIVTGNSVPYEQKRYSNYHDLYGKVTMKISARDSLSVSWVSNYDRISIHSKTERQLDLFVNGERTEKWQTSGMAVNHSHNWIKNIQTNLGAVYSEYENTADFSYLPIPAVYNNTGNLIFNTNYIQQLEFYLNTHVQLSDFSNMTIGLEFNHIKSGFERFTNDGIEDDVNYNEDLFRTFSNRTEGSEFNGFAEDKLTLFEKLKLTLGTRLTYNQDIKLLLAEPRVNASFEIWEGFSAQASWGMFHQNFHSTPSSVSFNVSSFSPANVWIHSQKRLDPSRAQHWLIGLGFEQKKWATRLSAYYKSYSNLTFIFPSKVNMTDLSNRGTKTAVLYADWLNNRNLLPNDSNVPDISDNNNYVDYFSGIGHSKGIELFIAKKLGIHTGFISYHLSSTRYKFPYITMGKEFTADYDRTHELKILNSFLWHRWNLGCLYTIASGKPYPLLLSPYHIFYSDSRIAIEHPLWWHLDDIQRTPAYQSVDLSLSKKMGSFRHFKLLAGATIQNVFNHENVIGRYYSVVFEKSNNSNIVSSNQINDQKGTGRLFNVFVNIEF